MLPYGASRDVSTDHENQLDENRRTLVSVLPGSTRLALRYIRFNKLGYNWINEWIRLELVSICV